MSKSDARSWLTAMVACGIGYLAISLITAALGAALGAFGLAAAAVVHALTSAEGNLSRLGVALIVWPVMTAVPAFLVALVVATPLTPRSSLPDAGRHHGPVAHDRRRLRRDLAPRPASHQGGQPPRHRERRPSS